MDRLEAAEARLRVVSPAEGPLTLDPVTELLMPGAGTRVLESRLRQANGPCTVALFETYQAEGLAADESITGDEALATLSTTVRSEVTGLDVVFSWYDGQIVVGFHDITEESAEDRVGRIAVRLAENQLRLDAGLAFRSNSESVGELIQRASDALSPVWVD